MNVFPGSFHPLAPPRRYERYLPIGRPRRAFFCDDLCEVKLCERLLKSDQAQVDALNNPMSGVLQSSIQRYIFRLPIMILARESGRRTRDPAPSLATMDNVRRTHMS